MQREREPRMLQDLGTGMEGVCTQSSQWVGTKMDMLSRTLT